MKKYLFIAAVAALALTSCQQEKDFNENNLPGGKNEVSFVLQSGAPTRSGDMESPVREGFSTKVGQVDGQSIYLEETITDLDYSNPETKGTPVYTENLGFLYQSKLDVYTSTYKNPTTGAYKGDVTYYKIGDGQAVENFWCYGYEYDTDIWGNKTTDKVDFAFRMPSDMTSHGVSGLTFNGNATTFDYVSPTTATATQDIVFGGVTTTFPDYISDYKQYGGTKVKLYHALTGVKFAIANPKKKNDQGQEEGLDYGIQIKKITFTGLANGGTCTFTPSSTGLDGGSIEWTSTTTEEGNVISQTFDPDDLVDYAKPTTDEDPNHFADSFYAAGAKQNINDAAATKTFWLVPQAIKNSDATITITFDMNGKTDQTMEISLKALYNGQSSDWEPAQIRTYTFRLDDVNVTITDQFTKTLKNNVQITNTGNTDAYIRAAIIGQWVDQDDKPVFGFTDYKTGEVVVIKSWYDDYVTSTTGTGTGTGYFGTFTGLPGNGWTREDDGYYYYETPVKPNQSPTALFTSYTVNTAHIPPMTVGGQTINTELYIQVATQAVTAKKLDGTTYTRKEAWTNAKTKATQQ